MVPRIATQWKYNEGFIVKADYFYNYNYLRNRLFPCGVIYLNAGVSVATLRTGAASLRCYGVLQLIGVTLEVL